MENDNNSVDPNTTVLAPRATTDHQPTLTIYAEENLFNSSLDSSDSRADLSSTEKNLQVQQLMQNAPSDKNEGTPKFVSLTIPCTHYQRNCSLYCKNCEEFFSCHLCHDENIDSHTFNRFAHQSTLLKCLYCGIIQPVQETCTGCGILFGKYFCTRCLLIENDPQKKIFHCDECGICRIGDKSHYFHCPHCRCCLNIALKNSSSSSEPGHKCIERSLESNCPICGEYLFTSRSGVIFMACGHPIHYICHEEHIKRSYQCPICLKSIANMSNYFNQLDQLIASQPMPPELSEQQAKITCNDCTKKNTVKYHLSQYHKCPDCCSYNTSILEILK